jgi:hypothetical protein
VWGCEMIDNLAVTENNNDPRDIVTQCCLCEEFKLNDGSFRKISDNEVKKTYNTYLVSHTYCPPCMDKTLKEYRNVKIK